jgi:hypothetical protein
LGSFGFAPLDHLFFVLITQTINKDESKQVSHLNQFLPHSASLLSQIAAFSLSSHPFFNQSKPMSIFRRASKAPPAASTEDESSSSSSNPTFRSLMALIATTANHEQRRHRRKSIPPKKKLLSMSTLKGALPTTASVEVTASSKKGALDDAPNEFDDDAEGVPEDRDADEAKWFLKHCASVSKSLYIYIFFSLSFSLSRTLSISLYSSLCRFLSLSLSLSISQMQSCIVPNSLFFLLASSSSC